MKNPTTKKPAFKIFAVLFWIYLGVINFFWLIICIIIFPFGLKWRYDMEAFSGMIFDWHLRKALIYRTKKLEKSQKK